MAASSFPRGFPCDGCTVPIAEKHGKAAAFRRARAARFGKWRAVWELPIAENARICYDTPIRGNYGMTTVIIGGGAAGIAAAITAAENGQRVTVLERNRKPLKKLGVTGNGRANVLNAGAPVYYGDTAFALAVLQRVGFEELDRLRRIPAADKHQTTAVTQRAEQLRMQAADMEQRHRGQRGRRQTACHQRRDCLGRSHARQRADEVDVEQRLTHTALR